VAHQFPALATVPDFRLPAAHLIWRGIESYLQEMIGAAVRSQLASFGLAPPPTIPSSQPMAVSAPAPAQQERSQPASSKPGTLIAEAIASYLHEVEPPQREPKTYDEYRLVLHKFRDTCSKRSLEEIDRDDLLAFRRQLYSLGNEARTVFNRMGIVLQLLKLHGIERLLKKGRQTQIRPQRARDVSAGRSRGAA
jgi:hypothetical protein